TTRATVSSDSGKFVLNGIPPGNYKLVISYVGYNSASVSINEQSAHGFTVELPLAEKLLDEVAIKINPKWEEYFSLFKMFFLGKGGLQCIVKNPKTLHFEHNDTSYVLTAEAGRPLIIENRALGYRLHYDLSSFVHYAGRTRYSGDVRFEELVPQNNKEQKKWKANREQAYYGSSIHFMRSLVNNTLKKDDFIVKKLVKAKVLPGNPMRSVLLGWQGDEFKSTDTVISMRWNGRDYAPEDTTVGPGAGSSTQWGNKMGYNILYPGVVPYENIVTATASESNYRLSFDDSIFVTYKKKATSILTMLVPETLVDIHGNLADPHAVISEGYWATLRVADQLPFDYEPEALK
ncbi:MAG TPA: carboxypeptidase-like regulatory domain-containing protein, partial [Pedobacter sp.]|uniref:carboxypeptidase-like regulatory domain-containing protein n=1 Tax=Pedobacter sp. TaxID=1411316 RepID=UPI002CFE494F